MKALKDGTEVHDCLLGSVLSGADSLPAPNDAGRRWVEMYDRYQTQALSTRLGIPMLYGDRRGPRPRRRQRRDDLPAQHRHGLHARSGARRSRRARDRARDRAAPASTGPSRPASRSRATSAGAAPTRATAKTRELAVSLGAAAIHGFETATDGTRDPRDRQALPRRRRHAGRQGPGRRADLRRGAAPASTCPATSPRSRPASAA